MRVVDHSAGSGISWIREAFGIFRTTPMAWISLSAAWILLSLILMMVPVFGAALSSILQVGFFAGMVLACRDQAAGKPIGIAHLFEGFKAAGRPLIQIGCVTLLADILIQLAFGLTGMFDAITAAAVAGVSLETRVGVMQRSFTEYTFAWLALVATIVVVHGTLWFSAAIIAHQPMPATHAMRWSFFALVGNAMPLLVFALVMFVLLVLAMAPLWLGLIVYFPVYIIAHYTSYKAVFPSDAGMDSHT